MSNLAVLSYNQFQEFVKTGVIPEFFVNQTKIPAYAMESWRSKWRTKEYKLFPENVTKEDLWYIYTRMDIAANAVDIPAEDAWGKGWQIRPIGPDGKDVENDALVQRIWQI
ncbi:MAG: hypothetical protein ACE5OO_03825, partial [Candidatus Bathyarchaeia archaeon]